MAGRQHRLRNLSWLTLALLSGCASFDPAPRPAAGPPVVHVSADPQTAAPAATPPPAEIPAEQPQAAVAQLAAAAAPEEPDAAPPVQLTPAAAAHAEDLWPRLREGFHLPRSRREARQWAARYANERVQTRRMLERAELYLPEMVTAIEQRGMPLELAFLPAVESDFEPTALSPSQALGLWQFIPYTGQRYGLRQSWWYDGRRDVPESTRAALDYLQYLHGRFGDWLLAIAAYNSGEGRVQKAIEQARSAGRMTDFWSISLPLETRDYVPKLLGMAELVDRPALYGFDLAPMPGAPRVETVEIPGQVDLALAARLAGISLTELQRLNPGFHRWATDPEGPHRLVVPHGLGDRLRSGLAEHPAELRVSWDRHSVQRGETLQQIADSYGLDARLLRQINSLRRDRVHAGDELRIPPGSVQRLARADSHPAGQHTVRSGDSLWLVARRHGLTTENLARWNGLTRDSVLRPGQQLRLSAAPRSAVVHTLPTALVRKPQPQTVYYVVRSGDSLSTIARRFSVTIRELMHWNSLRTPHRLRPGQKLRVLASNDGQTTDS